MAVDWPAVREQLGLPDDASVDDVVEALLAPRYTAIEDVELITVGIDWPAMPEDVTVTLENLVDAMVAANEDPLIRAPRVKLGHGRMQLAEQGCRELGDHDPFWDGEPAFGTVVDLRLTNDGAKLVGDLVEVPGWLADTAPSGWPNRSCEWAWDVETEGGKRYSMVITAVGLLGVQQQAIKDLADLQRLMAQGPDDLEEG